MFKSIREFIFGKPTLSPVESAPYKVELPLVQLDQASAPTSEVMTAETSAVVHYIGRPAESSAASMNEELKNPLIVALEQTFISAVGVVPAGTKPTVVASAKKSRKSRVLKAEIVANKPAAKKTASVKKLAAIKVVPKIRTPRAKKS